MDEQLILPPEQIVGSVWELQALAHTASQAPTLAGCVRPRFGNVGLWATAKRQPTGRIRPPDMGWGGGTTPPNGRKHELL